MSRHEILEWVNAKVQFKVSKLEELCSGAEYCQMLEQIYPNCVGLKRIKIHARLEHEFLHNFKLLQAAFTRLGIGKVVPVERLIKGRFQDNLEFIQWFRKFYENAAGADGKIINKENSCSHVNKSHAPPPPFKTSKTNLNRESKRAALEPKETTENLTTNPPSPTSVNVLQEQQQKMEKTIAALHKDRDFYLSKLTAIEKILNESIAKNINTEWCDRVLEMLYNNDTDDV